MKKHKIRANGRSIRVCAPSSIGHTKCEDLLLRLYGSGRMHHAWLFTGPRGIGKATLAYRLARFVLSLSRSAARQRTGYSSFPPETPGGPPRRVARPFRSLRSSSARSIPRRNASNPKSPSRTSRRAGDFFGQTAGEGGYRICIVDAADDLNHRIRQCAAQNSRGAAVAIAVPAGQPRPGASLPPSARAACGSSSIRSVKTRRVRPQRRSTITGESDLARARQPLGGGPGPGARTA